MLQRIALIGARVSLDNRFVFGALWTGGEELWMLARP